MNVVSIKILIMIVQTMAHKAIVTTGAHSNLQGLTEFYDYGAQTNPSHTDV